VTAKKSDKKPSREEQCIAAIKQLGGQARTTQITEITGITVQGISGALHKALARGAVVACKVTTSNGGTMNEYRIGSGQPDTFRPLNTGRRVSFNSRQTTAGAPLKSVAKPFCTTSESTPQLTTAKKIRTVAQSNGGGISVNINSDASVRIYKEGAGSMLLNPDQVLALGDFLHATEGLWRP
jgi:hypothetical protein